MSSSEAKKTMVLTRKSQETEPGDTVCNAQRGTKCAHKVNLRHQGLGVPLTICAIGADPVTCVFAGKEVI